MEKVVIVVEAGGDLEQAKTFAKRIASPIVEEPGEDLTVVFGPQGIALKGYGLSYQGDFDAMSRRVTGGHLQHEMLARVIKNAGEGRTAIDATAGMGEDAFIIAAYGYKVTLHEQNPVIALLLKDAISRARQNPEISDIANRMQVVDGDSVELLRACQEKVDLIYLDPMFPQRQKSGLINKKLQLIQKLEPPCSLEEDLFDAAIAAGPAKIVVKRPLKSPNLAGKKPNYMLKGKAIRYDCYVY